MKPLTINLSIKKVKSDSGNTGDKKQYQFAFSKNPIIIEPNQTDIYIQVIPKERFNILAYKSASTKMTGNPFEPLVNSERKKSISIPCQYNKGSEFCLAILAHDSIDDTKFCCDQKVINSVDITSP